MAWCRCRLQNRVSSDNQRLEGLGNHHCTSACNKLEIFAAVEWPLPREMTSNVADESCLAIDKILCSLQTVDFNFSIRCKINSSSFNSLRASSSCKLPANSEQDDILVIFLQFLRSPLYHVEKLREFSTCAAYKIWGSSVGKSCKQASSFSLSKRPVASKTFLDFYEALQYSRIRLLSFLLGIESLFLPVLSISALVIDVGRGWTGGVVYRQTRPGAREITISQPFWFQR